MDKYYWEGINHTSKKDDWEKFEKNNLNSALNASYAKKWKYILPMLQNITQVVKTSNFLMIPNGKGWHYLGVKDFASGKSICFVNRNNITKPR